MKKALIISDGKPGHFNQSIALCKHLGVDYEIVEVAYRNTICRVFSFIFDWLGIYTGKLVKPTVDLSQITGDLVLSVGSTTYYTNKLLSRRLKIPNIAIHHPQGYRLDFTHFLCPAHDHPPKHPRLTELPINLCATDATLFAEKAAEFKTIHPSEKPAIGIIVGGSNSVSKIISSDFRSQLEQLFSLTEGYERWITTSRRTPKEIEEIVESFPFDYKLINSRDPFNPIPAFIQLCDRLFVTSDSTSMISECASFGKAKVEILMNRQFKTPNKFEELIHGLENQNAAHVFDGSLADATEKIDLGPMLRKTFNDLI